MLATWTGAKAGASWTMTSPPPFSSITIRSSAGISRQALAGAAAISSEGVRGGPEWAGGAAAWAAARRKGMIMTRFNHIRHSREMVKAHCPPDSAGFHHGTLRNTYLGPRFRGDDD
jgi:hypothetical protein